MRRYIICGYFRKFILVLFISIIFQIINEAIYGFNYYENIFDDVKIFNNIGHEYFSKHILIHLIFSHIGSFIFTIPFYIYEIKVSKEDNMDSLFYFNINQKITLKHYLMILLIIFLWIVEEYLFIFYTMILGGFEFWFFELLIICYLTSKMDYLISFKQHKLAIIINLLPLLLKFISIILSIKLEKNISNLIYIKHIWLIHWVF